MRGRSGYLGRILDYCDIAWENVYAELLPFYYLVPGCQSNDVRAYACSRCPPGDSARDRKDRRVGGSHVRVSPHVRVGQARPPRGRGGGWGTPPPGLTAYGMLDNRAVPAGHLTDPWGRVLQATFPSFSSQLHSQIDITQHGAATPTHQRQHSLIVLRENSPIMLRRG